MITQMLQVQLQKRKKEKNKTQHFCEPLKPHPTSFLFFFFSFSSPFCLLLSVFLSVGCCARVFS
jgi:hypothetical protein